MLFWHPHPDLLLAIFVGHTLLFKENLGVWFEYLMILQVDIRGSIDSLHAGMLR